MALVNCEEATRRFEEKLRSGYFRHDRSLNNEVDYPTEKEDRDTAGVEEFAKTGIFKVLYERS